MDKNLAIGTGRRKTAVARVYLRDGSGKIVVNGKDVKDYFVTPEQVKIVYQPLLISRALLQIDPDNRPSLKANGYLTRDSRMVERKKFGQRGARRRFQFSKR